MRDENVKMNTKPLPIVLKIIMRFAEMVFAFFLICILIFDINLILNTLNFPSGFIFLIWAVLLMIEVPFALLFCIAIIIFEVLFYKDRKLKKAAQMDGLYNFENANEIKNGD